MMKAHIALYGLAAAILVAGVVTFGLPASSLWLLALLVVCPLMMVFMMRGMHGDHGHVDHADHESVDAAPPVTADRRGVVESRVRSDRR